jgi:acyl-CoA thioesterase
VSGATLAPFDAFTAVEDGRATIDAGVSGFLGAFGGYVMTLALRAMAPDDAERTPRSLTIQLPEPAQPGAIEIDARTERTGGSTTSASSRLVQDGRLVGLALATFGRPRPSLEQHDTVMPDVPPPEACKPLLERPVPGEFPVEHRPARDPLPLTGGDRAELLAWMRIATDDRAIDAAAATFLADALAPGLYGALDEYVPLPSVEIALHYADTAPSDSPWVLAVARNRVARDGYAIEDGELWTPDGRLLIHSRQLRRILSR